MTRILYPAPKAEDPATPLIALAQAVAWLAAAVERHGGVFPKSGENPPCRRSPRTASLLDADLPHEIRLLAGGLPTAYAVLAAALHQEGEILTGTRRDDAVPAKRPLRAALPESLGLFEEWWSLLKQHGDRWLLLAREDAERREFALEALAQGKAQVDGKGNIVALDDAEGRG